MAPNSLRVLLIEDNPGDARLVKEILKGASFDVEIELVKTTEGLRETLIKDGHDVVICDFNLGKWTAIQALAMIREGSANVPFIVVSGTVGDETAAECIKQGATDYVLKDRMARLPSAIERALEAKTQREERQRAESALRASEAQLRLLLDSTGEGIYGIDLKGHCTFCNPACVRLLGFHAPEDLLGKDMTTFGAAKATEGAQSSDDAYRRADGTTFPAEYHSYPIRDNNETVGHVVIFLDITERKALEEQYRQAQKMESVGRLAGGVAHDFNNLLTVINGYGHLLMIELAGQAKLQANVDGILKAGDRAAELTRQLLAFSRKQPIQPLPLHLNAVVAESEEMLHHLLREDIVVKIALDAKPDNIMADHNQLHQTLMNLVVNAQDAMPQGGRLTIKSGNANGYVTLSVSDSGQGMSAETKAHIFEPFYTTKGVGHGTGLGLATVFGIVTQANGYIDVESEIGKGATFHIHLPQSAAEAPARAPKAAVPTDLRGFETVMVAEDQGDVRKFLMQSLGMYGYKVMAAADGDEALRTAAEHTGAIHLLLTDVVMPGMDGRMLAERLTKVRPSMRVMFMSGHTDDALFHRGMSGSDQPFLSKPFTPEKLAIKVREVLSSPRQPA